MAYIGKVTAKQKAQAPTKILSRTPNKEIGQALSSDGSTSHAGQVEKALLCLRDDFLIWASVGQHCGDCWAEANMKGLQQSYSQIYLDILNAFVAKQSFKAKGYPG